MNKGVKIILISLIVILISIGTIYIIDAKRFEEHKSPLVTLAIKHYDYLDGSVTEYYSLGWKFINYDREWNQSYEKDFFFGKLNNSNSSEYELVVNTYDPCLKDLKEYAESSQHKYYSRCVDNISVNFKNGVNKELKDAFKEKMISLSDLLINFSKKEELLDGGSTIYEFSNYKIVVCNRMSNGSIVNKNVIIGDDNITKEDNLCGGETLYLTGTISNITDENISLNVDSEYTNISDLVTFTFDNKEYKVGDKVKVYYNGDILEVYPAILNKVIKVELIK